MVDGPEETLLDCVQVRGTTGGAIVAGGHGCVGSGESGFRRVTLKPEPNVKSN